MKSNSQLSDVLHVLLHMAERDAPMTSDTLAAAMQTHPVVLRRLMGGLRDAGFVYADHKAALDRLSAPPVIVECVYRNGKHYAFWYVEPPADLKRKLNAVKPRQTHCPAEYTGPSAY